LLNLQKLEKLVEAEVIKNEKDLVQYKKGDLLDGDIYGTGAKRNYAWKDYEDEKRLLNPQAEGNVDLILTGRFIDSFYLLYSTDGKYLFDATNPKKEKLITQYGKGIMSMNQKKFNRFLESYVKEDFVKEIKKQLGQ
jgi:hypothetical protein